MQRDWTERFLLQDLPDITCLLREGDTQILVFPVIIAPLGNFHHHTLGLKGSPTKSFQCFRFMEFDLHKASI